MVGFSFQKNFRLRDSLRKVHHVFVGQNDILKTLSEFFKNRFGRKEKIRVHLVQTRELRQETLEITSKSAGRISSGEVKGVDGDGFQIKFGK